MADWVDPSVLNPELVAGKPWTDEKASQAFENVVALAEGASGAPLVHPAALDVAKGFVTLSGTTPGEFLGLDRFKAIRCDFAGNAGTSGGAVIQVRYSSDNGASWTGWLNLTNTAFTGAASALDRANPIGVFRVDLVSGVARWSYVTGPTNGNPTFGFEAATHGVPANCNAVSFRISGAGHSAFVYLDGLSGVSS